MTIAIGFRSNAVFCSFADTQLSIGGNGGIKPTMGKFIRIFPRREVSLVFGIGWSRRFGLYNYG